LRIIAESRSDEVSKLPGSDRIWPLIVWSRSAWVVPLLVRKSLMS